MVKRSVATDLIKARMLRSAAGAVETKAKVTAETGARTDAVRDAVTGRLPDKETVAEAYQQMLDRYEELAGRLGPAKERATEASLRAARTGSLAAAQAAKSSVQASKGALKQISEVDVIADLARRTMQRLADPEAVVQATRRAADRLFPELAKQRRAQARKRTRSLVYRGAGLTVFGLVVGWLTAPKRGQEARGSLKEQAVKASSAAKQRAGRPNGTTTAVTDQPIDLTTPATTPPMTTTFTNADGEHIVHQRHPADESAHSQNGG